MEINKDETFLARWMQGNLNDSELEEFKNNPDFQLYEKIIQQSGKLSAPPYDKQKLFSKVQNEINSSKHKQGKVRSLFTKISFAAAASVAILLSVFYYVNSNTSYNTDFGEQLAVNLPDGSEAILNAKSAISFKKRTWNNSREINLEGEAFFKVKKGKKFVVKTALGDVTVLGTQFNVNLDNDLIEVNCYEGKVKVTASGKEVFLTKGKAFRAIKNNTEEWEFKADQPSWHYGESTFSSIPLKYVIDAIQQQYNVEIKASSTIDLNRPFTGAFTHNDLKIALETVFVPLKIRPEFSNKTTILLVNE